MRPPQAWSLQALLLGAILAGPLAGQDIPANAVKVTWGKGWTCTDGHVERGETCIILGSATDDEVRLYAVRRSIAAYSGSCPCPENVDRAGRRCGARSAYSRPGGQRPLCYPQDVSAERIRSLRKQYPTPAP